MRLDQVSGSGSNLASLQQTSNTAVTPPASVAANDVSLPQQSQVQAPADSAALNKSVAAINQFVQPHLGSIEFSIDDGSGKTLIKVVDKETDKVLMQIPSKVAIALSEDLGKSTGLLIKESA